MPAFFQKARDPISSYSHFIGAGLSLLGLFVMAFRFIVEDCTLITVLSSLLFHPSAGKRYPFYYNNMVRCSGRHPL